jgi:phenylpropionate dioxygenase-like ring-hydroxylating dioxygenase large terminal subunit
MSHPRDASPQMALSRETLVCVQAASANFVQDSLAPMRGRIAHRDRRSRRAFRTDRGLMSAKKQSVVEPAGLSDWVPSAGKPSQPRRSQRAMLKEGEDGLFTQSWFVVCQSSDVKQGEVIGRGFLDGRVAIYRGANGKAQVLSAYCPHLGADVSNGFVQGNNLQCPFHFWEYDQAGKAVKTAIGDKPPAKACLFRFPTVERWGLIWAFNGDEPLWQLPDLPYPDDELYITTLEIKHFEADPWVGCCNTLDLHHFLVLHKLKMRQGEVKDSDIRWSKHSVTFDLKAWHWNDVPVDYRFGIFGTTLFYQETLLGGKWFTALAAMAMPRPGYCVPYGVFATRRTADMEESMAINHYSMTLEKDFYEQDNRALTGIHFREGLLLKRDRTLSKFLDHLKRQPRAHPSRDAIR